MSCIFPVIPFIFVIFGVISSNSVNNENNEYLRKGFPLRIYVKISVIFTCNSGFMEACFFTLNLRQSEFRNSA